MPSPQLRTKDHAVHAGPSQQLVLLKVLTLLPLEVLSPSQSNNSLIAQRSTEISAAMVVLWTMPSPILKPTRSKPKVPTHTKVLVELALMMLLKANSTSDHTVMLPPTMPLNSKLPLPRDQFPLLLKPTRWSSNSTMVVSLTVPLVEQVSTTVSSLLVTELKPARTTGSLRTHGVPHGESLAT